MRSALYLIPVVVAAPCAVHATTYLTLEQAQAQMFPGQTLHPDFRHLTSDQTAAIRRDSGESPLSPEVKAWRADNGGWLIVDEVVGKHEFITFATALDAHGAVRDIEILDYREAYGGQVRNAAWLAQFVGKQHGESLRLEKDIQNISGATLSSKHITDGVRRILATYALILDSTVR